MLGSVSELYRLLSAEQRSKVLKLQFLVVLMALAEMVSVFSIGPFMALVGDVDRLQGEGTLARLYEYSGFQSPRDLLFVLGMGVMVALSIAACMSMYTTKRLAFYGQQLGAELSARLYRYYMGQPWLFHSENSSSKLITKTGPECNRLTNMVITQMLQLNARIVLALVMAIAIFIYNPVVATTGFLVFVSAYSILYSVIRKRLADNGARITIKNREKMQLMQEGFGGIKDTILLGRQEEFCKQYSNASLEFGGAQGANMALAQVPRYAMELIAFGTVILLVLYLISAHGGNLGNVLPILAVYALAGFKLLPAFQQIYVAAVNLRSNLASYKNLRDDLKRSQGADGGLSDNQAHHLHVRQGVSLDGISFRYPGKQELALRSLTMSLPVNNVVGLVGSSGAGKSTAVDMLLGLIEPLEGSVLVDGEKITKDNLRLWQNAIGYVPQSIFLADASIRENIAFGIPYDEIDEEKVLEAARMAHLDELMERLECGLDTNVGERGVQLSGGQRQRIGIARALYDDPEVLILDEATSALDGITEKAVMDAIHDFAGKKTILMIAHRLSTVQPCDFIYMMESGEVVDIGRYDELLERNETFQRMVEKE